MSLYDIQVWSNSGVLIADISRLCKGRRYTIQRNEAETFSCTVDLDELEKLATSLGEHPRTILQPYQTNLRIKRAGVALMGCQVIASTPDLGRDAGTISVVAEGYLNLLKERHVTHTYTAVEATSVAAGIISVVQGYPNGDMGITINGTQYATGVLRDREFDRDNAKDKLQRLTTLENGRFDFDFSLDKVFTTYEALGAIRSDLALVYGDSVKHAGLTQVLPFNHIIGIGSGFGADQIVSLQDDAASQAGYYMREKIEQFNSVVLQETLDQNTAAVLERYRELRNIPVITITGNELPSNFLHVGDRLFIDLTARKYTDNVRGWHRLERMEVTLDDNDFETDIKLYFDNQYVDQDDGSNV